MRSTCDRVAKAAAAKNVYLEINGSPERLDLGGTPVRTARSLGAKFQVLLVQGCVTF